MTITFLDELDPTSDIVEEPIQEISTPSISFLDEPTVEPLVGPLPQPHRFPNAAKFASQAFSIAEQFSEGGVEALNDVVQFLGGLSEEEVAQAESTFTAPQGTTEEIAKFMGALTTPSVPGLAPIVVLAAGQKVQSVLRAAKQPVRKGVESIGRYLSSLKVTPYNDNVIDFIAQKPETIFKPKKRWRDIHRKTLNIIKGKKKTLGKRVGDLKKLAVDQNIERLDISPMLQDIDTIKLRLPKATGKLEKKTIAELENIIKSAGLTTKSLQQLGMTGSLGQIKISKIDMGELEDILNSIDNHPVFSKIVTKSKRDLKPAESAVLEVRGVVKNAYNKHLENIDNTLLARNLIEAKGDYSTLLKTNRLIGELTPLNMAKRLESSTIRNHEEEFELLQKFIPEDRFQQIISNIINSQAAKFETLGARAARPGGLLGLIGEVAAGTAQRVGGALAGEVPKFRISPFATAGIRTGQAFKLAADIATPSPVFLAGIPQRAGEE